MKKYAFLFIIVAGIIWGCLGTYVRKLAEIGIASFDVVLLRAFVTAVFMFFYLLIFKRQELKIKLKDLWCFLGTGILSIIFFNFCYFGAMTKIDLAVAAVLLYTAPAIVMVLSVILFKEKLNTNKIISLVMTFAGCVLVSGIGAGELNAEGVLLGLGAGFGYALYSIFSRYALDRGYSSMTITFYTFLIASIGSLFIADTEKICTAAFSSVENLLICVSFGIVGTIVPYLCYTYGLKYVENSKASIMASIEPATATIVGIVIYGEQLTLLTGLGVLLVLTALVICNLKRRYL